jgi:hypothetical protein
MLHPQIAVALVFGSFGENRTSRIQEIDGQGYEWKTGRDAHYDNEAGQIPFRQIDEKGSATH